MPAPKIALDPWPFDRPLPSLLTPGELMRVKGLRPAAFYRHQRAGDYKHLEVQKPAGVRRYSGYLVDCERRGMSTANYGAGRLLARRAS